MTITDPNPAGGPASTLPLPIVPAALAPARPPLRTRAEERHRGRRRGRRGVRPTGTSRMPHLPGLDGLRALAVIAVVLYHLDLPWIPGGFLGVDVFFVLSGFLITTLVVEEIEQTGRLSFREFYLRRGRRLLPALWLLLLVVSLVSVLRYPEELPELRGDVPAALLYVSNWWYALGDQSYFEAVGRPALLAHLWSLAVEEQFYLLWPALAVAAMAAGRRRLRLLAVVGALASTGWMTYLAVRNGMPMPADPSRLYYGLDTHLMGLLTGAALATLWFPWRAWSGRLSWLSPAAGRHRAAVAVVDVVGLACLAGLIWAFGAVEEFSEPLYRGGFLAVSVITAGLVAALAHPAGVLGRLMATQPLRWIGQRSYGIYLWHWPVFMLTRPGYDLPWDAWWVTVGRVGLTLVLAEASYRFVEMPVRRGAIARAFRAVRGPGGFGVALRLGALAAVGAALVTFTATAMIRPAAVADASIQAPPDVVQAPPDVAPPGAEPTVGVPTGAPTPSIGVTPTPTPGAVPTGPPPTAPTPPPTVVPTPSPAPTPTAGPASPTPAPSPAAPVPGAPAGSMTDVSAFGDSVLYGARGQVGAAGAAVDAAEARRYSEVFAAVTAADAAGTLRKDIVVHTGNNGAIAERDLRRMLDGLSGHRVFLVSVHVPRSWEAHNNEVFAAVARDYRNVTVLDWHAKAQANPTWLYPDGIHLVPPAGRNGYAAWLAAGTRG